MPDVSKLKNKTIKQETWNMNIMAVITEKKQAKNNFLNKKLSSNNGHSNSISSPKIGIKVRNTWGIILNLSVWRHIGQYHNCDLTNTAKKLFISLGFKKKWWN